jgi:flagellar hook-associated protein 3 FlgL
MRVSEPSFTNNYLFQLNQLGSQQNQLQAEAATGLKVTAPGDDPGVMGDVLTQQAQNETESQYQTNITALQGTATATANVISSISTVCAQASQIATEVGGVTSTQDMATYATQLNGLIGQAVQIANTESQGSYLLGGTQNSQPPYVATTDSSGNITAVTYQGNSNVAEVEIAPGQTVSAQMVGSNTSGSGAAGLITDSRSGADLINHLIQLRNDLQSGNASAVMNTDQSNLTKDQDNITTQVAANGVMQSHLQAASAMATQTSNGLNTQISSETNADLATVLTELSQTQNSYEAALEGGSKIMQISLVDFLA